MSATAERAHHFRDKEMKHKLALSAAAILIASMAIFGFDGQGNNSTEDQGIQVGQNDRHSQQTTTNDKKHAMCNCPMMAQMSPEHMKGMRDTDARLNSLVNVMETTSGDRKADATSSIVKILVEGRATMHKMMMADHKPMMADMKGGACNCPMMAQMSPESMKKTHETSARLEALVETIETSSGDRKADATSSIVKILVEERAAMHKMMMAGK